MKLRHRIWFWFYEKSPIFISLNLLKFYSDWWKVRKIFRRPVLVVHKNPRTYLGNDYLFVSSGCNNSLLRIESNECGWKSKWGEVRFECVPYLAIYWKKKLKLVLGLECPFYEHTENTFRNNNLLYWEGILSYLHENNKDIMKTFKENIWTSLDKTYKYTLINGLRRKYAEYIIRHYNENNKREH